MSRKWKPINRGLPGWDYERASAFRPMRRKFAKKLRKLRLRRAAPQTLMPPIPNIGLFQSYGDH